MIAIGAGIAALACIGAGIGIGIATSKAAEAGGSREQDHQDLTVRWCAGRGNRYLRIRYRYPDHSVHGITIRSRMRHRQASNACICKLFCDDLR